MVAVANRERHAVGAVALPGVDEERSRLKTDEGGWRRLGDFHVLAGHVSGASRGSCRAQALRLAVRPESLPLGAPRSTFLALPLVAAFLAEFAPAGHGVSGGGGHVRAPTFADHVLGLDRGGFGHQYLPNAFNGSGLPRCGTLLLTCFARMAFFGFVIIACSLGVWPIAAAAALPPIPTMPLWVFMTSPDFFDRVHQQRLEAPALRKQVHRDSGRAGRSFLALGIVWRFWNAEALSYSVDRLEAFGERLTDELEPGIESGRKRGFGVVSSCLQRLALKHAVILR